MARKREVEIDHYIQRLQPSEIHIQRLLLKQAYDMDLTGKTQCGCGKEVNALNSFRCVYCGQFLCVKCAEEHFGVTSEAYDRCV
jgi:hypothetical protein